MAGLIGGGIVTGVGATTGVLFTVLANNRASEAESLKSSLIAGGHNRCTYTPQPPECMRQGKALDEGALYSNVAFWSFVSAGAVGIGTLLYGIVSRPPRLEARVRVMPMVGANDVGLSVGGTF